MHWYNEIDNGAATWLEELIAESLIPKGVVDRRSIKDVQADDLRGFTSCHFFAGIGIWPAAMRAAGWPEDRPVGSGSCPCQPFSAAGKGLGFEDPRHLWPHWMRILVEAWEQGQCWADTLFGEQVATAGLWLDLVRADLEDHGAAFASVDLPAAGFAEGAHIRQRAYWLADRDNAERWADLAGGHFGNWPQAGRVEGHGHTRTGVPPGGLGDASSSRSGRHARAILGAETGSDRAGRRDGCVADQLEPASADHRLGHHQGSQLRSWGPDSRGAIRVEGPALGPASSLLGCDWLLCHDARIRPVAAGTFPLAASDPTRVGLLRGYGNALDFETAVNFVAAFLEAEMFT